jgi:hypothetical protein
LQRRYNALVMAHSSIASEIAAGLRALPGTASAAAATQGAWRFFSNPDITLPQLAEPLIDAARSAVAQDCLRYVLVPMDWSRLDYGEHTSKKDRIVLQNRQDLGYKLLTALALSDRGGEPIAPVCLELKAGDGVHSTRQEEIFHAPSALDGLAPVMAHLRSLGLGRPLVFIIDREADSVRHHRIWDEEGHLFLVRADENPGVVHAGAKKRLKDAAAEVALEDVRDVEHEGVAARQFVGETTVILARAASRHRTEKGRRVKTPIRGKALTLRLVVSEVRDAAGEVLSRWLLLTNLPADVDAATVALWYYWRWRIESYHKLLKSSGQRVESWQQDDAATLARRLLVSAMACVLVWQLARDLSPQAAELRQLLVRLSGRQMKRGKNARGFTEPALLAGLGVLLPMLQVLEETSIEKLRALLRSVLPLHWTRNSSG